MIQDFSIVHRRKPHVFTAPNGAAVWSTCLRSLAFENPAAVGGALPNDEVYSQSEAYQFLLEIVCGLKSPIVGETEVFGQFKAFTQEWVKTDPKRASLIQRILGDAKTIRNQYLSHLGTQSYGSWVRKNLKAKRVHILGGGLLAQEILPYLLKQKIEVVIHVRDTSKINFFDGAVCDIREGLFDDGALLVAAPISADQIKSFLGAKNPQQIFDLRETSESDAIRVHSVAVFGLHEIFAQIAETKLQLQPRLKEVQREIRERSAKAFEHSVLRPQGWDDLCA